MNKVTVLGAGSWGTALAILLASKGQPVRLWCRNEGQALEMQAERENKKYLPGAILPELLMVTTDMDAALNDVDFIVMSIPTQNVRSVLETIKDQIPSQAILVNTAKGLEVGTNLRLSQVFEELIPGCSERFVALYGPSHAEEVGRHMLTTIVAASKNKAAAEQVQDLFMAPTFRVYTNQDLIGVEIGGAIKNIIAIATGIAIGLGLGDNAQAGLLTRGMAEISRLGIKLGAQPLTFSGLTGIGDLVVTCTSVHSRNHRCGLALGQGQKLEQVLEEMGMVVEGVKTTKATVELAKELGISMPIAEEMYKVLFEDLNVKDAVTNLMTRTKKSEQELDYLIS